MEKRIVSQQQLNRRFQELANGVIIQAAEDYREALQQLKINPQNERAMHMKEECEEFFRSRWFRRMTRVGGIWLMHRLRKEVKEDYRWMHWTT